MNHSSQTWNRYVIWIAIILTILSLISMIYSIPEDSMIPYWLLIIRNLFALIGPIAILVFWLSFRDARGKKMRKLAKEFGLTYEGLPHSVLAINDPEKAVLNKLSGVINGHDVVIEDRQKLHWVPLGYAGAQVASRKTVILIDQIEQKICSPFTRFVRVKRLEKLMRTLI